MNRDLYMIEYVSENQPGGWLCGKCFSGTIQIQMKTVIVKDEHFAGHFKCSNPICLKNYMGLGNTKIYSPRFRTVVQKQFMGDPNKYLRFYPEYFTPTLPLLKLPESINKESKVQLESSFQLFWSDTNASGNAIRIALEFLMDELGIDREGKLHNRLEKYHKENNDLGNLLMAIKWIGNAASHGDNLTKEDLLNAYEILEQFFVKLYPDGKYEEAKMKADEINRNKGIKIKP